MKSQSAVDFTGNYRIHIALSVQDIEASKQFYSLLLNMSPSKIRSGYAKFEPEDPSLNLALNEVRDAEKFEHPVSHFGIQVKSTDEVEAAIARFKNADLDVSIQSGTSCCHALQDKVWVGDPDGNRWEVFVVLERDAVERDDARSSCCGPHTGEIAANASCC